MTFADLPPTAAWRHRHARSAFEVTWFEADAAGAGRRLRGHSTGLEDGQTWSVAYDIRLDDAWRTRWVQVRQDGSSGEWATELEGDGTGRWLVDGAPAPEIDGCLDVDLEASAMTNTLPIHRLELAPGVRTDTPAAYVRLDLTVQRLDQTYRRLHEGGPDEDGAVDRFDYAAPVFDFTCELRYDASGLVLDYPGIAVREV